MLSVGPLAGRRRSCPLRLPIHALFVSTVRADDDVYDMSHLNIDFRIIY
jgi:hypothetical protein